MEWDSDQGVWDWGGGVIAFQQATLNNALRVILPYLPYGSAPEG
jgi:hypothetical protein